MTHAIIYSMKSTNIKSIAIKINPLSKKWNKFYYHVASGKISHSRKKSWPRRHLLVQSQQWKHQNNVWNKARRQWRCGVFIVNFEHISYIFLMFPLLTLNKWVPVGIVLMTLWFTLNIVSVLMQCTYHCL